MPDLIDLLRALPYFENCSQATLDLLAAQALKRHFEAGTAIFHEDDPALGLWLIEQGSVKIYKLNLEGVEHILHLLGSGDTFDDIAALDGGANPAHAAALSETSVWLLPSESLDAALAADPVLARHVIYLLAGRVRGLVHRIEDLTLYGVVVRLARFLLQQADDPALSAPGVTRAAIAAYLATTPETISRALRTLEDSGAIRFDRHRIVILREDLLRELAAL
ncbi:MAG TPA: Crp/Fnr family transcriptional regulator [Phototrophicaceae bacterium]|nr:Crp/Fnr family transcriptional regulator [Phototrophicaceae bacterium]